MENNFDEILIQLSKIIGHTNEGLTNTEIDDFIKQIDRKYDLFKDKTKEYDYTYSLGLSKRERIKNFGLHLAHIYNETTALKLICESYFAPARLSTLDNEKYKKDYSSINKILNTAGFQINKDGIFLRSPKIRNIDELNEKWSSLYTDLKEYNKKKLISSEILLFCDLEAKKDFYYHVIDQVCKHLEEKIKKKLISNDDDNFKKAWNLLEEKVRISKNQRPNYITDNFEIRSEATSTDYQNGYVLFTQGILKYARNVFAHTSRKNMGDISKEETISLLITISRCYDFLDSLNLIHE